MTKKISCIIPAYNEETNIKQFIEHLYTNFIQPYNTDYNFEVIIIDDGSCDNTLNEIKSIPAAYLLKIISFSRNFGKEAAISAGLKFCTGDAAIIIDADFQHPLELLTQFINLWQEGYDMVYGIQIGRPNQSWFNKIMIRLFYLFISKCSETNIPVNAGDFRLLNRKVIDAINQLPEYNKFMKGIYSWVGFKSTGIEFVAQPRPQDTSKWSYRALIRLASHGVTSFTNLPLRMWSIIGIIISCLALLYGVFVFCDALINGVTVPGYATIVVAMFFLGGIQILSIGVLGEYVSKIFSEVKKRPLYIVKQTHGFKDLE